jgi:hypothetical protein
MARGNTIVVIYIMNATQMKSHPANDATASNGFTRIHWFMAVVGIATAIICSLVLLTEVQPNQDDGKQSFYMSASTSSIVDQIKTEARHSAFQILTKF